jgi:histidine triad (HIT) family protein
VLKKIMRYTFETNPTVFGKILRGEIPCRKVYEDDHVLAFHDIHPLAPIHVLIIPKPHIVGMQETTPADAEILGKLMATVNTIATQLGVAASGYRLITSAGAGGGQDVFHLHIHLLADPSGKPLPKL